jgi:hypothetical protein
MEVVRHLLTLVGRAPTRTGDPLVTVLFESEKSEIK